MSVSYNSALNNMNNKIGYIGPTMKDTKKTQCQTNFEDLYMKVDNVSNIVTEIQKKVIYVDAKSIIQGKDIEKLADDSDKLKESLRSVSENLTTMSGIQAASIDKLAELVKKEDNINDQKRSFKEKVMYPIVVGLTLAALFFIISQVVSHLLNADVSVGSGGIDLPPKAPREVLEYTRPSTPTTNPSTTPGVK